MRLPYLLTLVLLFVACGEPGTLSRTPTHSGNQVSVEPTVIQARSEVVSLPAAPAATPALGATASKGPSVGTVETLPIDGLSALVTRAIRRRDLPGCVIAVGNRESVLYLKAFGERSPGEPMTPDTLFDLASLTKPIATATTIMQLAEQGKLALDARLGTLLPAFAGESPEKANITVRQLLTHTSGLKKVAPLRDFERGLEHAIARIAHARLAHRPGATFDYSDLGFITLGAVAEKVSGEPLDVLTERALFAPLAMRDTRFRPPAHEIARTAPTEERDNAVIRGVVDDPRAYRLGGAAGHAGLFSTAADVSRFARMMLNDGVLDDARVLSAETVRQYVKPIDLPDATRTLGWDIKSSYSEGRGTLLSEAAVGHGGYTGTALWIDPKRDLFVVLLSNRVYGHRGSIHPLTSSVVDLAAHAIDKHRAPPDRVRLGIDELADEAFARLRGARVGLLTHVAARDSRGVATVKRLLEAPRVHLKALFAPEHGLSATHEGHIENGRFGSHDIPVYGLFGKTREPSDEMLDKLDVVVIDLVDVGTRFYTYTATALRMLRACAERDIDVLVLDRPNPIGGHVIEGPISEPAYASFVNYYPLPLRHGMTEAELLRLLAGELNLPAVLDVVRMSGYRRDALFDEMGLSWHAPSPNLQRYEQAMLYPAVALVEGTNVSVGRGTEHAFEVVAAPYIRGKALAERIAEMLPPSVEVSPTTITPTVGPFRRKKIEGVRFRIADASAFRAAPVGLAIARALASLYPDEWEDARLDLLVANASTLEGLRKGVSIESVTEGWQGELTQFEDQRKAALLY
jgi:uncharacterized protein YbbC (DUF1343 family)